MSKPPTDAAGRRPKFLLVVEDDPRAAQWLATLAQHLGHKAVISLNGGAALDLVKRASPDMIFVDLGLPDIAGHDLIKQFRAIPALKTVKIYVVSASGDPDSISASRAAGAEEHFVKPMRLSDLQRLLA